MEFTAKQCLMSRRLRAEDWIEAALGALAEGGFSAVRIEALARKLKVSKGSFYWHFKDLPALLQVVLTTWEDRVEADLAALAEAPARSPADRLLRLAGIDETIGQGAASVLRVPPPEAGAVERLSVAPGGALDMAIRAWARQDPAARAVQARVDRRRLAFLAAAFDQAGCREPLLRARATLAARIGFAALSSVGEPAEHAQAALALVVELLVLDGAGGSYR